MGDKKFEFVRRWKDGPMLAKGNDDEVYAIETFLDIKNWCLELLSDEGSAIFMPIDLWTEVTGDIHKRPEFISKFFQKLAEREIPMANLAFTGAQISDNPVCFWNALEELDDSGELFPKGVTAAAESCVDVDTLAEKLAIVFIDADKGTWPLQEENFFSVITLDAGTDQEEEFYIYSPDDPNTLWEVSGEED